MTAAPSLAAPATTADVAARVRDARAAGDPLRLTGAGTWMDAGAPCAAVTRLPLGGLTGIVEYEPGDLTLTARAGTTLAEIAAATAAHGQWLPLDPPGSAHGTIGATVATASYGPLAAAFGTPRNQVLGCEVVTGAGDVIRAGGRVVKNVAGFDVTRLMIGAWGTLGAITEVTVRLRARPEVDTTVAIALGGDESLERARRWIRAGEYAPLAAELLSPALAARVGITSGGAPVLLLRLGGNAALVRAALHAAISLGDAATVSDATWRTLAGIDGAGETTLRLSAEPARIATLWHQCAPAIERAGGVAHANLTRGVVRCVVPAGDDHAARVGALLAALPPCTRIVERGPELAFATADGDPVRRTLALGVRRAFDPDHLLNPGIMAVA